MTEDAWWALLDSDPGAFPWDVFADWLEEGGDARADAARHAPRYAPRLSMLDTRTSCWDWWLLGVHRPDPDDHSDLPGPVFRALTGQANEDWRKTAYATYDSPAAAYRALLDALAAVGAEGVKP